MIGIIGSTQGIKERAMKQYIKWMRMSVFKVFASGQCLGEGHFKKKIRVVFVVSLIIQILNTLLLLREFLICNHWELC